jgi:CheY-like chemotaxis protein
MPARGYVLVVDDDPDIRVFLADMVADEGYVVLEAPHGQEALEIIRVSAAAPEEPEAPALILLDYNMPVMDGPAFARAYRQLPPPHAPIVCLTAAHDARKRAAEMGADDYLGKPFSLDHLAMLLEKYAA